jgi:hypothetical protein
VLQIKVEWLAVVNAAVIVFDSVKSISLIEYLGG